MKNFGISLANEAWVVPVVSSVGVVLVIVLCFITYCIFKVKAMNKRSQESNEEVISIAQALGGKTNVKHVEVKGSRLTAYIEQMDKINYEVLEKIGTGGVITMETKIILVLGNRAIPVAALLK